MRPRVVVKAACSMTVEGQVVSLLFSLSIKQLLLLGLIPTQISLHMVHTMSNVEVKKTLFATAASHAHIAVLGVTGDRKTRSGE